MKDKKTLIIIIAVVAVVVIGLVAYFAAAGGKDEKAKEANSSAEQIETKEEIADDAKEPSVEETADDSEAEKEDKKDGKKDSEKSDSKKEESTLVLPEPDPIPEAKSDKNEDVVAPAETPKEETKYGDAEVYTNKNGQLAAKTESGTEVELTGDNMQRIFEEYEKVRGTGSDKEKELLDQLQLILERHEVMELEEK